MPKPITKSEQKLGCLGQFLPATKNDLDSLRKLIMATAAEVIEQLKTISTGLQATQAEVTKVAAA